MCSTNPGSSWTCVQYSILIEVQAMSRQWMTLMAILLVYIPVAIDATVLHVAAPTLSVALGSSGNELLWIIDIYSLGDTGWCCPMGALAIRSGFSACCSAAPFWHRLAVRRCRRRMTLIASRFAGGGAAMIVRRRWPGSQQHLCRQSAQYGAGAVGSGRLRRRGLRPAGGRYPAGAFHWGRCSDQCADRAGGYRD